MIIYHLGFSFGWYEDRTEIYLGCYSSQEKREEAKHRHLEARAKHKDQNEYFLRYLDLDPEDGNWDSWETELDVDFRIQHEEKFLK